MAEIAKMSGECLRAFKGKGRASTFEGLGYEVLHRILELVEQTSTPTLLALSQTNHHLHVLSLPHLYRRILIHLSPRRLSRSNELIRGLLADDTRRGHVREIVVRGGPEGQSRRLDGAEWGTVKFLSGLLLRLQTLDKFEWLTALVPPANMSAFLEERFPSCRLALGHWDGQHPRSFPLRPGQLVALTAVLSPAQLGSEDSWNQRVLTLQRVLGEARALRHLGVRLAGPREGKRRYALDLGGMKLPGLRTLELEGYRFTPSHAGQWASALDTPKLQALSLRACRGAPHLLSALTGRLPGLRSLTLADNACSLREKCTAAVVLASLLMDLSLCSLDIPGEYRAVLAHLRGGALRRLVVHTRERADGRARETLSVEELERVADWCPGLRELGVDLDRRRGWPRPFLSALAGLRLDKLTLFLELGLGSPPVLAVPEVDEEGVRELWGWVSRYRVLPELEVWVGEWGRPLPAGGGDAGGAGERWAAWEGYNRRRWGVMASAGREGAVVRDLESGAGEKGEKTGRRVRWWSPVERVGKSG
ncbi:hypothetical protein CALVIDRAFT_564905 [Calocera viscosa TUFC12733]|uniref:F-box domain-containing protein n=1 Tax=Calocera viscosa (strain TUFC12733) TaxID=1330018 RepID=A0A167KXM0_CALVF|nr:hypothetical protein CALVIDRAFT_564905 [Calocera viscosa TUFC12733]